MRNTITHTGNGAVLTDLVLEIFRCNGLLLATGDKLGRPLGLTSARWQVLGAVANEARTVSQIARAMGLTRQSVQRTADRLGAEGMVAFEVNPHHRSAKLVRMSAQGRQRYERITAIQTAWVNGLAAPCSGEELETALRIVRQMRAMLENGAAD